MVDHNGIDSLLHGQNSKLFMAGGAVALIIVVYEYRKTKLTAAATATPVAATDTSGSDGGYYDPAGYSGDTSGLFTGVGYTDPATGAVITGGSGQYVAGPTTNMQWSQSVQAMLTQTGYNATDVAAALGHYLVGTQMSADQWTIVQAGIGLVGYPPQSVPPANVAPASGGTAVTSAPADGYYMQIPFGLYYMVQGGKLFNLRPATVVKLKQQRTTFKNVLVNNPIFKLPKGTPNPV